MKVVQVNTWNELMNELFIEAWNPQLGRFRAQEAYRGLSDSSYALETSLIRLRGEFKRVERHLIRNFRKYAHRDMVEQDSIWHWISLAQHHGLATRLLDWTYSPLVALHFVTANLKKFHIDGVIWAVNFVNAHRVLPKKLSDRLDREGANIFTVEMLSDTIGSLKDLDALEDQDIAIFLEPPSIDDRIVNQHALFSMMSNASGRMDMLIDRHENIGRKIIIPASLKWEIRDKLDQSNMHERVLFPGLDGLSSWLKRQYSPKVCT